MRTVRRYAVVVSLLLSIAVGSAFAGFGDDGLPGRQIEKESHKNFIQRILDFLDSRLSTPPG